MPQGKGRHGIVRELSRRTVPELRRQSIVQGLPGQHVAERGRPIDVQVRGRLRCKRGQELQYRLPSGQGRHGHVHQLQRGHVPERAETDELQELRGRLVHRYGEQRRGHVVLDLPARLSRLRRRHGVPRVPERAGAADSGPDHVRRVRQRIVRRRRRNVPRMPDRLEPDDTWPDGVLQMRQGHVSGRRRPIFVPVLSRGHLPRRFWHDRVQAVLFGPAVPGRQGPGGVQDVQGRVGVGRPSSVHANVCADNLAVHVAVVLADAVPDGLVHFPLGLRCAGLR